MNIYVSEIAFISIKQISSKNGGKTKISLRYNEFLQALFLNDLEYMNEYMNRVAMDTFRFFDVGGRYSGKTEPERLPEQKSLFYDCKIDSLSLGKCKR